MSQILNNTNTETHEAGHYLNLKHPWGSGTGGAADCDNNCVLAPGFTCEDTGDEVCDTDPCVSTSPTLDCASLPIQCNLCEDFEDSNYVYPADNYMSYGTNCHYRFTPGQITRMHDALEEAPDRYELWQIANLDATGTSDAYISNNLTITATSISPATCSGQTDDGAITIAISGGSGDYTLLWSNGATSQTITGLAGAWYSVDITDNISSEKCGTASFYVPSPTLTYELLGSCVSGSTGEIDITILDASGNVVTGSSYAWDNLSTLEDQIGLSPDAYSVNVTTPSNCSLTEGFDVPIIQVVFFQEEDFFVDFLSCDPLIANILAEIPSYFPPEDWIYNWMDSQGITISQSQNLENVPAGNYSLEVTNPYIECTSLPYLVDVAQNFISHPDLLVVSSVMVLEGDHEFLEGVRIVADGNLTVSDGVFRFNSNKSIRVESGGVLDVREAELRPLCSELWDGIYAEGPSTSQSAAAVSISNTSIVRKARIGIRNSLFGAPNSPNAGGLIYAEDAKFIDCISAIEIDYRHPNLLPQDPYTFTNCSFEWTQDLPALDMTNPHPLVSVDRMEIDFTHCDFLNTKDEVLSTPAHHAHRPAVYGYKATLNFLGEEGAATPNRIEGFRYGLVQYGGRAYMEHYALKNFRSAYVIGSKSSRFTSNDFGILNDPQYGQVAYQNDDFEHKAHYGLYLDNSTAYWVEDNDFYMAWDGGIEPSSGFREGLFVRSSGPANNEIYRNRFNYCNHATIAYDDNRNNSGDPAGLKYICNEFRDNGTGIDVVSTISSNNPGWGIHASQGVAPSPDLDGISAGNYFEGQSLYDIRNADDVGFLNYYWHFEDTPTGVFSLNTFGFINESNLDVLPYGECSTELLVSNEVRSSQVDIDYAAAEELRLQLAALVDGGDTESLLSEVLLSEYGEALELYYELMSKSPALSEAVMVEAINKEAELPAYLLSLILESNPQAAKSKEVEKELDERMMPLSEYQRYMIAQGEALLSSKERLESRIAYHEQRYHSALRGLVITILADTTVVDKRTEISNAVAGRETLDLRYFRIELAIEDAALTSAENLLEDIEDDFPLRGLKDQEYQDYMACYEIELDLINSESDSLNTVQRDILELIAYKHSTRASGKAIALLTGYDGQLFDEVLVDPEATDKSARTWRPDKGGRWDLPSFEVYPNPANEHLTITYRGWGGGAKLTVIDAHGRTLTSDLINTDKSAHVLNISELPVGSYTLILQSLRSNTREQRIIEVIR